MANPTTNFGWVMPTSTSLVTNLPADFNTFGQAVDTSMAQLKGGTTGQILSKTSATDMAFTWITNDVGDITGVTAGTGISGGGTSGDVTVTNSMATAMTTKGDLVAATGSGTFSRLAVGSNNQTLVADSTASTGLKWATASSGGTWTAYTPTLSGLTLGNGTLVAFYNNDGKTVNVVASVKWGSTTSASGGLSFSLPVSADITIGGATGVGNFYQANGVGLASDQSADAQYNLQAIVNGATSVQIVVFDYATFANYTSRRAVSPSVPMTWVNTDIVQFFISYKAA